MVHRFLPLFLASGCVTVQPVATGWTAQGNEPFWRIDVADRALWLRTPDDQRGTRHPVARQVLPRGVRFATADGRLTLTIRPDACQDSMADRRWPATATLIRDGETMTGCAEPAGR